MRAGIVLKEEELWYKNWTHFIGKTMKTTGKQFDAVKFMRQQRDKLSEKLSKMTKAEIIEYFKRRKTETTIKPCA